LRIQSVEAQDQSTSRIGDTFQATLKLTPGDLTHSDLRVELYHGHIGATGEIGSATTTPLIFDKIEPDGTLVYKVEITLTVNRQWGYTARILPHHEDLVSAHDLSLITWA
jgi:glycogen phosphorylase